MTTFAHLHGPSVRRQHAGHRPLRALPVPAEQPSRVRRTGILGNALAAVMIAVLPGRAATRSAERRPSATRPWRSSDTGPTEVHAPAALPLTRRSHCGGIVVSGGQGVARVRSYRGRIVAVDAPAVVVSDAAARVVLTDSRVSTAGGLLDATRSSVRMVARDQRLAGDVTADRHSVVSVELSDGSSWHGALDRAGVARVADVRLDGSSTWTLTASSRVGRIGGLDVADGVVRNIRGNGCSVRYCAGRNPSLAGRTLVLAGGGQLRPE